MGTTLSPELERRHTNIRAAMAEHDLDALVVSGSEYSGFEGAVTYLSGFQIVHRYAYVVVPADGEPGVGFPTEAPGHPAVRPPHGEEFIPCCIPTLKRSRPK